MTAAARTLRPFITRDAAAVRSLSVEAFEEQGIQVADVVEDLRRRDARIELVVEEEDDGDIVGHVLLSRCWVDARVEMVEVLALSPLSVMPRTQGLGIGTMLTRTALEEAERIGAPAVFLEGSPAYYGARGFAAATALGFSRPSVRIPEPAFRVAILGAHEEWMRGALVYCEPFWTHDCVGLRDPDLADIEQMFDS